MQITANTTLRRIIDGAPLGTGPDNIKGSIWALASNEVAAVVEGANYLLPAYASLRKGDLIICSLDNDGTPVAKSYIVTVVSSTAVTIVGEV